MTGRYPENIAQRKEMERQNRASSLAQRILSSVNRAALGDQTLAWLNNMNENVPTMSGSINQDSPLGSITTVNIMDRLFDDFERYSFHFNQTEPDRLYVTSCIRPTARTELGKGERYVGSLQNGHWTIIMTGTQLSISAGFMAARYAYEQEARRPAMLPFFELKAESRQGQLIWKLNGRNVLYSDLPFLSKMIFARLNRVSRGEVKENEPLFPETQQQADASSFAEESGASPFAGESINTIGNSLITMLQAIDDSLHEIDREGMMTLKTKGAQAAIKYGKQSEDLKNFRDKVSALAKEWLNSISNWEQ